MALPESMRELLLKKQRAREIEMEPFKGDPILSQKIPEIANEIFVAQFGVDCDRIKECFPLAFIIGWGEFAEYAREQPTPEFAITVAGVRLEYTTDLSESDKMRNIVPQMIHVSDPIFKDKDHCDSIGLKSNEDMIRSYEAWRTENLAETVQKVESAVQMKLMDDFGIDTCVSSAIIPMMAATYSAALQILKSERKTINMYNMFELDIMSTTDGAETIVLTPLASIKYRVKNDTKQHGKQ